MNNLTFTNDTIFINDTALIHDIIGKSSNNIIILAMSILILCCACIGLFLTNEYPYRV